MKGQQLPNLTLNEIRVRLEAGIQSLCDNHSDLFAVHIGENALSYELTNYLRAFFDPWHVNFQYDSFGDEAKRSPIPSRDLRPKKKKDHPLGHLVTPDIIVHKRRQPLVNLLAIEAKKDYDAAGIVKDREKLRSYQGSPLRYPFVALLVYSSGEIPTCRYELFAAAENPQIPKPPITLEAAHADG